MANYESLGIIEEKSIPTNKDLDYITCENFSKIRDFYEGLRDFPSLREIYPYLNFNELFYLTIGLRKHRKNPVEIEILSNALNGDFNSTLSSLFYRFYQKKKPKQKNRVYYEISSNLNPYLPNYNNFRMRIASIPNELKKQLISEIEKIPTLYVPESSYDDEKRSYRGYDVLIQLLPFNNMDYENYRNEVLKILQEFPVNIKKEFYGFLPLLFSKKK